MAQAVIATKFQADNNYGAGTAVMFGGNNEVTLATPQTTGIAGIVVADAELILNNSLAGTNVVAVATQGRVACRIVGIATAGDLITSASGGFVQSLSQIFFDPNDSSGPGVGSVIGRAITDSADGQVEILLGIA